MTSASVIGQTTVIRGGIRGEGDLEILGTVEGSIIVQGEVTIGETALIKSDVRASRVIVRGAVRGNVSADELLILEAGARVLGDLGAPQVGIRPGGLVKGHVSTSGPLPLERPKPAAAAKAAPAPARAAARGPPRARTPRPRRRRSGPCDAGPRRSCRHARLREAARRAPAEPRSPRRAPRPPGARSSSPRPPPTPSRRSRWSPPSHRPPWSPLFPRARSRLDAAKRARSNSPYSAPGAGASSSRSRNAGLPHPTSRFVVTSDNRSPREQLVDLLRRRSFERRRVSSSPPARRATSSSTANRPS